MLIDPRPILRKALRGRYAIGAFNVNNLELLQGILLGAAKARAPVIVQTSEGAIAYAGLDMLVAMVRSAAKQHPGPLVLHLDHGKNLDLVREAIRIGYTSVMYDGSALPYAENVANTRRVVRWAHAKSVAVEAELGALRGTEDLVSVAERDATLTIPEQGLDFVERTGCDSLAVAIGTSHGSHKGSGQLDIPRLRRIHALLPNIPLVLHGASAVPEELVGATQMYCAMLGDCQRLDGAHGIPDKETRAAIRHGIAKVNTDTDLRIAFTAALRETIVEESGTIDPRELLTPTVDAVARIVAQRIRVFGSRGEGAR